MQSTMFLVEENTIFDTATGIRYNYKESSELNQVDYPKLWVRVPGDNSFSLQHGDATAFWNRLKGMAVKP